MPKPSPAPRKPTPAPPRLIVRSSSIHAAGCYTLDPIASGRRIIEYDGPRISKDLANERYADRVVTYLFGLAGTTDVIDGFGTPMFVNHSCSPNCATESHDGRVFIRALRDIAANEELLYEYNLYDSDDNQDCYCHAPNCRGTMLSEDEVKRRAPRRQTRRRQSLTTTG